MHVAEFPIMPMHWDAYLGDTMHLSTIEHGAYLLLLGAMWRAGGSLPADDRVLARTTGLTLDRWRRMKPTIMAFMHPISGDRITQDKLLEVKSHVSRHAKAQSDRSRARWLKTKGRADAAASPWHSRGNANQISKSLSSDVESYTDREERGSAMKEASKEARKEEVILISSALAARFTNRKTG